MRRDDLLSVLKRLGIASRDIGAWDNSPEITFPCPLAPWTHNKKRDRRPSMSVRVNAAGPSPLQCFSCKFRAQSVLPLVRQLQHYDSAQDFTSLMADVIRLEDADMRESIDRLGGYEQMEEAPPDEPDGFPMTLLDEGDFERLLHSYARERGVTVEAAIRWNLRFDSRRRRVIIPLIDVADKLRGVSGRAVDKARMPPYLNYSWVRYGECWYAYGSVPDQNPPDQVVRFPKSVYLLGENNILDGSVVVLVEGQFDAILLDTVLRANGVNGFVPVSFQGNALSAEQAERLLGVAENVIDFTDNDKAGREARSQSRRLLAARCAYREVHWPQGTEGMDPGQLSSEAPEAALELLYSSKSFIP